MATSTPTNLISLAQCRLGSLPIRLFCAAAAMFLLVGAAIASTSLSYLVVPPAGNLPGAGNDGPGVYTLPGYGNVEVTMTNPNPANGATYFDQTNAYNETTNNAAENLAYGSFNWGTDTQRFDVFNGAAANSTYQFNFTFLSGAPNPADLYFVVDGLAVGTTATVSQAGNLVGEYQFPNSIFYPGGPSSTTLYNVAGPQTFSSLNDGDFKNTGWALWQPNSAILNTIGTGGFGTLSFNVNQIPGDGIGFTVGYTTVPEPSCMALLGIGSVALLSRRRRKLAALIIPVIALALIPCGSAQASLVINGGFETTTFGNGQLGFNTNAAGWTSTGYSFIFAPGTADTSGAVGFLGTVNLWGPGDGSANGLTISPNGGNFVAADGDYMPGPISQTINGLTAGNSYNVDFSWAGAQAYGIIGPSTEQWQVSFGAQTQSTPVVNNLSEGFTGWMNQTMTFTASGTSDVLSFLAVGTPAGEPPMSLLDGVSVNAVPEPSCFLLAGIGSLAVLARRRRKLVAMIVPVIALALTTGGTARANFVTNGGFELYAGSAPKDYYYNVLPTDWSGGLFDTIDAPGTADNPSSPGLPVYPGFPATSPAGGNFEQSDSTPTLALPVTQTINFLTVGQSYTLSFYQAAGQELGGTGATTDQWQVSLGAQTQLSSLMSIPQGGMSPWAPQTMTFTPSSTSELLSFVAIGTGGVPPQIFLDGVDMESNVPEPSAAMLLAGVGAVLTLGRLGRRLVRNRTVTA